MDPDKEHPLVNVNANVATVSANPSGLFLTNPVIMDKIFDYLTVTEVKNARKVCKVWESVGATCLGRRCSLSINKFIQSCKDDKIGICLSPPIKNQLVRSVYITGFETGHAENIDYDFLDFVKKYQGQIEEIGLWVDRHFARTIEWMLQNINFANLKKIWLDSDDEDSEQSGHMWTRHNFLPMPTVTTLMINKGVIRLGDEKDGFPYHQILQEIINNSPNLENMIIEDNFYPDLSFCSKLKVLEWKGYPFKPEDQDDIPRDPNEDDEEIEIREDFSFSKMFKMLDQVKDTLEEVVIGTGVSYNWAGNRELPILPDRVNGNVLCFPCLKSLSIYPIDVYMLGFEMVTDKELPSLKKLILKKLGKKSDHLNQLLLRMKTWTKVEYLSLNGLQCERDEGSIKIYEIVETFPSTTEFHLWMEGDVDSFRPQTFKRFKDDLMEVGFGTAYWNIQHLEIGVDFFITLSKLMEALGDVASVGCFKRLKTLKITSSHIHDGGCENFEKPFLALRSITFDKIKFLRSTLIAMVKFIRLHDLNVRFLNVD